MLLEYIPYKLIFLSIIVIFVSINTTNSGKFVYLSATIFIIFIFTLVGVHLQSTAKENIQMFNKNKTLDCISQSYYSNTHYNVSLKNHWRVDKNYFLNDIYRIRADNCEVIH